MIVHLLIIGEGPGTGAFWRVAGMSRSEAEGIAAELSRIPGVQSAVYDTADIPPVNNNALLVNVAYQGAAEDGSEDVVVDFNTLSWPDDPKGQVEWGAMLSKMPDGRIAGFCQNLGPAEEWARAKGVL